MLKSYVAFDLETTGLSVEENCIIEFGALKVRDGAVADRFMTFVKPEEEITERITEITGITNAMTEDAPPIEQVMKAFVDFCGDDVLIGHNLLFDFSFAKKYAGRCGYSFEKKGIDTLKIARTVCTGVVSKSLGSLCDYYGIVNDQAHRAYHDALATAKLYQTLAHYYENGHEALFAPSPLIYKEKKVQPATPKQKAYLKELIKYHKIDFNEDMDAMTRSQMSKAIDKIILNHGLPARRRESRNDFAEG